MRLVAAPPAYGAVSAAAAAPIRTNRTDRVPAVLEREPVIKELCARGSDATASSITTDNASAAIVTASMKARCAISTSADEKSTTQLSHAALDSDGERTFRRSDTPHP
jgi:hypothetical protein